MSAETQDADGVPQFIIHEAHGERADWDRTLVLEPAHGALYARIRDGRGETIAGIRVTTEDIAALAAAVRLHDLTNRAAALGAAEGEQGAAWVFDGSTTSQTYLHVLGLIQAGDPEMEAYEDHLPQVSEEALAEELGLDGQAEAVPLITQCRDAWQSAAETAFWHAVERTASQHVSSRPAAG
jgi:hypothetical protein